ncbi:MAG: S-layer homology domain-containing protein [Clostridiaceae bacterium]|nr:S-layer homology domain-containing protein [Clostridiaceae bacterium]
MKEKVTRCLLFFMAAVFMLGICLPVFAVAIEGTYYDAPLMDKQTAKNELLFFEDNSYNFKDIAKYWAKDEILQLSYMDIIKGYNDGTMQPDRTISREEFVAMLVRAIDLPTDDQFSKSYSDVTDKYWSHKYITAAKENGLLSIFSGYYLYPYRDITREEMAVITAKAVQKADITGEKLSFKDIPQYYRYKESIDRVTALGIITGLPDGSFDPKGKATRAQAAAVIGRVLRTREASKETDDTVLISFAADYEKSVLSSLSVDDFSFSEPLSLSGGKEANLNAKRAEQFNIQYSKGLIGRKYMDNESFVVSSKSRYLAEVETSYELVLETGTRYTVKKMIYLKNIGDSWVVYNSIPEFSDDFSSGKKINLTWHYIWNNTPDMSNVKKIDGLNVVSPTWFTLANENGDLEDRGSVSYSSWAHKNGYKVWALVDNKFNSELTNKLLGDVSARTRFINNLISHAKKYKLDGVNIDFENMYIKDKNAFTQFMKELSKQTKANGLVLSVDVSIIAVNSNWSESFDRAALSKVVDYVALMTYDQHWGGSPVSGSVAQLSWVEQSLKKVLAEVPKEKLLLGVPFYTRLWKEEYVNGSSKPVVTSKAISMEEAERTIGENKAAKTWDAASGQYYVEYKKDNATYKIWLEDEMSIKLKAELVNKYSLAGIASWKYGLEKPAVWNVIAKTIGTYKNSSVSDISFK